MAKAELLAMLTVHGVDLNKVSYGFAPGITQMDVAGMLSGLSDREAALVRVKYCREPRHDFWSHWFTHLFDQGWEYRQGQLRALAQITLDEFFNERMCKSCNGTKGLTISNSWVECDTCQGKGRVSFSDRAIAKKLGLKRLQEPWVSRLNWCRTELNKWEVEALQKMR